MGKAALEHTPDAAPEQPPLDDPRWLSIKAAHQRLAERTSDNELAVIDLTELLAQGRLPCMVRSTVTGERTRVAATAWVDQIKLFDATRDGVCVIYREPLVLVRGRRRRNFLHTVRDAHFYVWQPALDRIWSSGSAPVDHDMPLLAIDRAKAVLRDLYPTKAQMPRSLKAATNAVEAKCKILGWTPPSRDTIQRAAEELGYRPPRKPRRR